MKSADAPGDGAHTYSYDARARSDQLELLFRQSTHAIYMALVAAALWVALMWGAAERSALIAWMAAFGVTTLFRLWLFAAYWNRRPKGDAILRWERPYSLTLLPAVLVWGVGCLLVVPNDSLLHQALTFACLACLTGVAISTYSTLGRLTILVLAALNLPIALLLLLQGGTTRLALGGAGLLYLAAAIRGVQVHSSAVQKSFRLGHELHDAHQLAALEATIDPLTGILNRRGFLAAVERVLKRAAAEERPATMLLIDVDDLKIINDEYGHAGGDVALKHVVEILQSRLRVSDHIGRIGGDELAVLLPDTAAGDARVAAAKVQVGVSSEPVVMDGAPVELTVSIGVASHTTDVEELLLGADRAMYQAKRSGKNGLTVYQPQPPAESH